MHFEVGYTYHVYNRGNNSQKIFFSDRNYKFFRNKIVKHIVPNCELLAYCLMPTHFHFMLQANETTIKTMTTGNMSRSLLSEGVRILLSSYTQAVNKQEGRTGSLFAQNTKSKLLNFQRGKGDYAFTCFNYIHQNPYVDGLVQRLEDWKYSSFREYTFKDEPGICNKRLAEEVVQFDKVKFYDQSYAAINERNLKSIM